jgi:hypothetical protein
MLVTGAPPNCAGPGMPQRAIASSRTPSTTRTIGAGMSGYTPGIGGRLPARSRSIAKSRRMASWPRVML